MQIARPLRKTPATAGSSTQLLSHQSGCSSLLVLTEGQAEALRAIEFAISLHKEPPSLRELARMLGVTVNVTQKRLGRLERLGVIVREAGAHRGIRILVSSDHVRVVGAMPLRKAHPRASVRKREVG